MGVWSSSFVGLPAAGGPCVSPGWLVLWYPVRPSTYTRTQSYIAGRTSIYVSLRGPPRSPAGAPPGGACRRPPLPGVYIYMLYLTCRLPKVDMSVTEVVYTTKVIYLPVLINLGSQFDY